MSSLFLHRAIDDWEHPKIGYWEHTRSIKGFKSDLISNPQLL